MTRTQQDRMKTDAERAFRNPREAMVRYDARDAVDLFQYVGELENKLREVVTGNKVKESFAAQLDRIADDVRSAANALDDVGSDAARLNKKEALELIA